MTSVESIATGFSRLRSRYAAPLQMLFVLAGLLLFITCANLGGLLLARVGSRDRDLTVHAALGASSSRLARQLIAESTLLSVLAAALAVPVAWWLSRAIGSMVWTGTVPLTLDLAPDGRILVFVAGVAVVTGVLIGVLPARHAGRRALAGSPARTATPGTNRIGRALLAGQVALSLALIFPAGLLHRSLQNLEHLDIGFDDRDIGLARTLPLPGGYDNLDLATYYRELHERLEAAPGVEAVGFSRAFPGPTVSAIDMAPAGAPGDATAIDGAMELITPGFFRTIGMRVLDGRAFDWQDDERSRGVVIVNEVLARRLFDNGRAIGRRIRLGAEPHRQDLEIVGVVNDARFGDYRSVPVPMAFRPRWQEPALLRQPVVLVRSRLGSAEAERTLREVVASFRRESLTGTISLETQIDRTMTEDRLMARLSLWLGGMALVLAITGVYAVLAYGFARRRREIGVRLALGARPSGIARIVLRQGLGITLAGIALGVPLALVIGRAMTSLLFGLSPLEPVTLVLVAAACLAAAMLAAAIPALRASRVDPVVVLQAE